LSHILLLPSAAHLPSSLVFSSLLLPPPRSTLFPYTTLFRSRITSASCSRAHGSAVSIKLSLPTVTALTCSPLSPSRTDRLTDVVPISIPSVFIIRSIPVLWFSRSFSALPEYFYCTMFPLRFQSFLFCLTQGVFDFNIIL